MRPRRIRTSLIALASVVLVVLGALPAGGQSTAEIPQPVPRYPTWVAGTGQGPAQFVSSWGTQGSGPANFDTPRGIVANASGELFVADAGNDRIMRIYSSGDLMQAWGTTGSGPGELDDPCGVALSPAGSEVFVGDRGNDRIQVFRDDGVHLASFGSTGSADGQLLAPCGVAVRNFEIYVADTGNDRIQVFDSFGHPVRAIGGTGSGPGRLESPMDVEVTRDGRVVVADTGNHRVQVFTRDGQLLDHWGGGPGEGPGAFDTPTGVAADVDGNVHVVDRNLVQRFNRAGQLLSWWGTPGSGRAQVLDPFGIAVSRFGVVNVTDTGNHRFQRWGWARPDAMIRRGSSGALVGNDVYNTTGAGQTRQAVVAPGGRARFLILLEDTGLAGDALRLRGGRSTRQGTVSYRARGADVTEAVVAGIFLTDHGVSPYRRVSVLVEVRVRPDARPGAVIDRVLRADAATAVGADTVRFVVRVG